jgi:exodeoxyribonuclease VII small subunit
MAQKINFKELNKELESILEDFQKEQIDIEEMVAKYSRGQQIIKELKDYLKLAQNKITKLKT